MMKRFIVIGLGNFGLTIARTLEDNGCEVMGIDMNMETVQQASEYITKAVSVNINSREVLQDLMVKEFDGAVVSIGQDMAASILIALYLKELEIENIIVRALSDDHGKILEQIGVDEVIFPEVSVAVRLGKKLASKNAVDYLPLGNEHSIIEVQPPQHFIGKSLRELELSTRFHCQVIALKRVNGHGLESDDDIIIPPSADMIIERETIMVIIGKDVDIQELQKKP